jgi:multiple sugar transport system ATP-binding protein
MIYVTHDQVEAMTLADKIVLLRSGEDVAKKGSIAQVGSPLTLYHRPASLFVAEFIGSPKMNVLSANCVAATESVADLKVQGHGFHASVDARRLVGQSGLSLGVRPEDMRLTDVDGANVLNGVVAHIEKLGESSLIYFRVSGDEQLLTLKVEGTSAYRKGDAVRVACPADTLHVFDAAGDACHRTIDLPA